jgi:serpin B
MIEGNVILCPARPSAVAIGRGRSVGYQEEGRMNSQPAPGTMAAIGASINRFAFDLYHHLRATPGTENLIYSPYSLAAVLTMTYAGARGETAQQMADVLHLDLPSDDLHPAMARLVADYRVEKPVRQMFPPEMLAEAEATLDEAVSDLLSNQFRVPLYIAVSNAVWGQAGYPFRLEYLDLLAECYGSELRQVDFAAASEPARQAINAWIGEQTRGRIQDMLSPGTIDTFTRLVITNTIYFKGAWHEQFEEKDTRDGPFTRLDGRTVTVPMMNQCEHFQYTVGYTAAGVRYQAIILGYSDRPDVSMVIVVPDVDCYPDFEASLDANFCKSVGAESQRLKVNLTMPRFEAASGFSLADTLAALGMTDVFAPARADFSGMVDMAVADLYVKEVMHQAFIAVDEYGTEAGAASTLWAVLGMSDQGPIELTLDRPFIYAICDQTSGAILFLGRVLDPSV